MDLFDDFENEHIEPNDDKDIPLAERMRPRSLDEYVGQEDLVGEGKPLRTAISTDNLPSIIFWGPPGTGKTTLARLIALETKRHFVSASAVMTGVKEAREIIAEAKRRRKRTKRGTIFFLDEIHRWNKAQQDAFLPHVEDGTIHLIGSTTENPSFEVNSALLSRCQVYVLKDLSPDNLKTLLERAIADEKYGLAEFKPELTEEAFDVIIGLADGDARRALNALEASVFATEPDKKGRRKIDGEKLGAVLQRKFLRHDKQGEEHYNLISAFHKCLRDSDPQAAIYWLARMIVAGESPLYIARRMIRFASEDIGLADPQALTQAIAAKDSFHFLGQPEGELALVQAAVYLATAPKSNSLYAAYGKAKNLAQHGPQYPVPLNIRNAPTKLMKDLDYGKGYIYAHDQEDNYTVQRHLPDEIEDEVFYTPGKFGFEKDIQARMKYWDKLSQDIKKDK